MLDRLNGKIAILTGACLIFVAGWLMGQQSAHNEETIIHAVAWTAKEDASDADLAQFNQSTADFVNMVPGLKRAWVGKLRQPLTVGDNSHTHGLIFEFSDLDSREAYSNHPSRPAWIEGFGEVRSGRPVVYDVIGE
jgi:antibiotic biosynthesis monooxygenase (ABM) superfamily enzyme